MRRRSIILVSLLLLTLCSVLRAHVSFRLTGKITKWDKPSLFVASKEHGNVKIKVQDDFAEIIIKGKPGTTKDFKIGQSVVVDATGDSISDVEALKVNVDPAKPAASKPAK